MPRQRFFGSWFVCLSLSVGVVLAQTTTATLSGTVADQTGAVLPGVSVTVFHLETGESRKVLSDQAGRYLVPQLALGEYEVRAELSGFKSAVRRGITLTIGRAAVVNLTLEVGEVLESVEVTADAPLVDTQNSALSALVDERAIRDLPLNGRSFDNLITLNAGAVLFTSRERLIGAGAGNYFSVSGLLPQMNKFTLDGTEYNGAAAVSTTPGGISGQLLGLDAIREFAVVKSTYSAEFGKRAGGQVNVITKSGTNEFHGSVFAYHRNDNLDARNFFDRDPDNPLKRSDPPEFKRNSFGGVLGGPLIRNQTFFFGGVEGFREREGTSLIGTVPDENARLGLLPDPNNPGQLRSAGPHPVTGAAGLNPAVKPFLEALYPLPSPGGRNFGDGSAEVFSSPKAVVNEDFWIARIDHSFSDSDFLFVRYNWDGGDLRQPDIATGHPWLGTETETAAQIATLEEKHIFSPTVLNVFRFGFNRATIITDEGSPYRVTPLPPEITFVEGRKIGRITVGAGGRAAGALSFAGAYGSQQDTRIARNQFAFSDQLTMIRGLHAVKAGTEIQRIQTNPDMPANRYGGMSFEGLQELLIGRPRSLSIVVRPATFGDDASSNSWRQSLYGFFLQDEMRIFNNFTLNLGLRYEFLTLIQDSRNGGMAVNFLRVADPRGPIMSPEPIIGPSPLVENNSLKGLAPRVGFAWDPFRNGTTSVRAGFGMFYDQLDNLAYRFRTTRVPPYAFTRSFDDFPPFPRPYEGGTLRTTISPSGMPPDADIPTVLHYNFTVQREIFPGTVLTTGYVGSSGYHLNRTIATNYPFPEILPDGRKFFRAGAPRRLPGLATGSYWLMDGISNYHSFQVEVTQRPTKGLRFKGAYTFSKSIDTNQAKISEDALASRGGTQDPDVPDRGLASWDNPHNFTFNYTYDLPVGRGQAFLGNATGVANALFSGWQITGITTLASGAPATLVVGFDNSRTQNGLDRPDLIPGAGNNPILGSPDQWYDPLGFSLPELGTYGNLGRNTVRMDGRVNFDFSIFKNTDVTENSVVQFRAEFFNIFNHANFGIPDLLLFNSNRTKRGAAGQVRRTATSSRQIQLGLKFIF